ncbi:MAG: HAMP domain-containing sensor histidine kinase [Pseudomonadota bacterium]
MSSATELPLYRSSSFQLAILLTLVIWGISASIAIAVVALTERTLLNRVSQSIDDEVSALIDVTRNDDIELWDWFDEDIQRMLIDTESLHALEPEAHLTAYISDLRDIVASPDATASADANARLYLLGVDGDFEPARWFGELYIALLFEEVPDELREDLSDTVERQLRRLPVGKRWATMTPSARLQILVDALLREPYADERCVVVLDNRTAADSTVLLDNPVVSRNGFFVLELAPHSVLEARQRRCWVRQLSLPDNRVLLIGRVETELVDAVQTIRRWRNMAIVVSLLIAIALGALLGRRIFARLHDINALTAEIRAGNLERRLRVSERRDDFDTLSENINAMLDQITQLMDGVKQVSDNIAHDLRTPLTRLRNRIEQLTLVDSPRREDVVVLAEQADGVLATFTALLRIAQLERGSRRRHFISFDMVAVLREVVDLYDVVFAEHGTVLSATLPDPFTVHGDRDLWMQAFTNLLENCLKYAPDSTAVTITVTAIGQRWRIDVRDQGPGVPDHALGQLTERFYRVNADRTLPGTGLGLALVAAVCQLHDAELTFINDGGLIARITIKNTV